MDDGRHNPRPVAAVAVIDILHHLLTPLVLEVDVDVGRLGAVGRDEPLDQHFLPGGVDIGDAQTEADHRIGRRAPALAQDRIGPGPGPGDDVVDGQEIGGVAKLPDQPELFQDDRPDRLRDAARPSRPGTLQRQPGQPALGGIARRDRFVRVLIAELPQRKGAGPCHRHGSRQRRLMPPEQPRHLGRRLQMAFGIGLQPPPCPVDGHPLADAGQDVLKRAPPGMVIQHRIGRDHRRSGTLRHGPQPVNPCTVIAPPQGGRRQIQVVRPAPPPCRQPRLEGCVGSSGRRDESDHPFAKRHRLFEGQPRLGLFDACLLPTQWGGKGLALALGQQAAQAAVSGAVAGEDDQLSPVGEAQPRPDDQRDIDVLRPHQRPDHARQCIAVGHPDGGQPQGLRL